VDETKNKEEQSLDKQLKIEQESREKLRKHQRRHNNKQSKDPNANRYHSGILCCYYINSS
jgi:hypothetical protein